MTTESPLRTRAKRFLKDPKTQRKLLENFGESTAMLLVSTPIMACLEDLCMSEDVSRNARALGYATTLGGAWLLELGRQKYRDWKGVSDDTNEIVQHDRDRRFYGGVQMITSMIVYGIAGAKSAQGGLVGGVGSTLSEYATGGIKGRLVDVFKSCMTGTDHERVPHWLKQQSLTTKRALVVGSLVGSYALMEAAYAVVDMIK